MKRCKDCKWWTRAEGTFNDRAYGDCQKNAPIGEGFPKTWEDAFCGELEEKK